MFFGLFLATAYHTRLAGGGLWFAVAVGRTLVRPTHGSSSAVVLEATYLCCIAFGSIFYSADMFCLFTLTCIAYLAGSSTCVDFGGLNLFTCLAAYFSLILHTARFLRDICLISLRQYI